MRDRPCANAKQRCTQECQDAGPAHSISCQIIAAAKIGCKERDNAERCDQRNRIQNQGVRNRQRIAHRRNRSYQHVGDDKVDRHKQRQHHRSRLWAGDFAGVLGATEQRPDRLFACSCNRIAAKQFCCNRQRGGGIRSSTNDGGQRSRRIDAARQKVPSQNHDIHQRRDRQRARQFDTRHQRQHSWCQRKQHNGDQISLGFLK